MRHFISWNFQIHSFSTSSSAFPSFTSFTSTKISGGLPFLPLNVLFHPLVSHLLPSLPPRPLRVVTALQCSDPLGDKYVPSPSLAFPPFLHALVNPGSWARSRIRDTYCTWLVNARRSACGGAWSNTSPATCARVSRAIRGFGMSLFSPSTTLRYTRTLYKRCHTTYRLNFPSESYLNIPHLTI